MREIDAEYYGYLDDDDNLLVEQEEKCEKAGIQKITNQIFILSDFSFCLLYQDRRKKIEDFKKKLQDSSDLIETENNADLEDEKDKESVKKQLIKIKT